MKYFIYFLIVTATGLLIFNTTMLDFTNIFGKESSVALVGILACLCVIVLMIILLMSKAIKKKVDG